MMLSKNRATLFALGALLLTSACNGSGAIPTAATSAGSSAGAPVLPSARFADTTSILKLLTKDVVIGSTVDPGNGDTGPRSISVVQSTFAKLKKGQILVCNFADSSGDAGKGTTIEQFNPTPSSKPTTFVQSSNLEGCNGDALTSADQIYGTGSTSKVMSWITQAGKVKKKYGSPITDPLADTDATPLYIYSPEIIFIGNSDTGAIDDITLGGYGTNKVLQVINGFDVNKASGLSALGPSGLAYDCGVLPGAPLCQNKNDVLYVADGACNTIVAISHASSLLVKDEITIQPGCKTFKCLHPKTTCATVVKSGSPLNAPVAEALLPNGNLIVANTQGGNTLVELTPAGKVLDTKVVDKSSTAGIFGLAAAGTKDSNTALFYTDTNTNTLHELEQ